MIAAASESKHPAPALFLGEPTEAVNKEKGIDVLPASTDPNAGNEQEALRAYQVETMRLKDELM